MKRLCFLAACAIGASPALATQTVVVPVIMNQLGQTVGAIPEILVDEAGNYVDASGGGAPRTATSTSTGGTIATANTFQSVLASNSARKGCLIQNTSANNELAYLGAPGSATAAASVVIPAGGSFNCASPGGLVVSDQISLTSSVVSASYVVVSQ